MLYLVVDANLSENIKRICPKDTESNPAEYTFDLVCTSCREKHDSTVVINRFERTPLPGSRGEASFVMKCKFCGKEVSIDLNPFEDSLYNDAVEDNKENIEKTQVQRKKHNLRNTQGKCFLLSLDCRGCEVTGFYPDNLTFLAELSSGKTMEFQLEDGELYDYDDDSGEEVTVTEFKSEVVKGK
ncbi:hypothetical protein ZYGR_0N07470 [Zygosaccharomyces rouxii]|uniref:ZYRO0D17402p n=2 Tax=Zygosaccharomyces rouxii TaxID=4956 RepID=C5DWT4_ZYGRC|nr:uncharacterized protein ZYRO0D17402g [Zygosaccharomyces rouxii]KAH9201163.1 hypothetical protein LQ764DRAFT_209509 [Zygosaccharomyces rouxii]GAV49340.1 hypothetical protein ZYGR_0N07470 [Zygosaccharomyces rouxii]CAR28253.1 ZYRO0D17402p [Zygosaccharomyces rouxii]